MESAVRVDVCSSLLCCIVCVVTLSVCVSLIHVYSVEAGAGISLVFFDGGSNLAVKVV